MPLTKTCLNSSQFFKMKLIERPFIFLLRVCLEQNCLEDNLLQFVMFTYYRTAINEIKVRISLPVACYPILDGYRNT